MISFGSFYLMESDDEAIEKRDFRFDYVNSVKESHKKAIFACQFNPYDPTDTIFVSAGGNRATIYSCEPEGQLSVLQVYEDGNDQELFYTCAWSYDPDNGAPILAVAGQNGIIKIIDTATRKCVRSLKGHGGAINEVKFFPGKPHIIISASKDYSIRIWNYKTDVLVAVLGGEGGHRDEVLGIDVHQSAEKCASCGMDNSIKIWDLKQSGLLEALDRSETFHMQPNSTPFPTLFLHFPIFSTSSVHKNYVDCVRFFGDLILSKSTDHLISFWKPGPPGKAFGQEGKVHELQELRIPECEIWYLRFFVGLEEQIVACGNQEGKIFVWDLLSVIQDKSLNPVNPISRSHARVIAKLINPKCKTPVRQVAINASGRYLIAVCDDATVWRWDRVKNDK